MIGSLLYVTASRPDVMFSVCMCARFQASPRESHLKATKRILRYLKHTPNVGLWYPKGAKFELVGYSDSIDTKPRSMPRTHAASQKGPLDGADPPSFSAGMVDPAQSSRDVPVNLTL